MAGEAHPVFVHATAGLQGSTGDRRSRPSLMTRIRPQLSNADPILCERAGSGATWVQESLLRGIQFAL